MVTARTQVQITCTLNGASVSYTMTVNIG
jgi:hypothetical protein